MKKYSFYTFKDIVKNRYNEYIYLNNVYGWMSSSLLITSLVSWYTSKNKFILEIILFNKIFILLSIITQIIISIILLNTINKINTNVAITLLITYSILTGLNISSIFLIYSYSSITTTFFITSLTFGIMSLWGYITNKDLTKIGNIILMLLIGLTLSTLVNFIFKNPYLSWITSYISIIIFSILIAWDTQKLKEIGNGILIKNKEQIKKYSILGALMLYLDIINLYLILLKIIGENKEKEKFEEIDEEIDED